MRLSAHPTNRRHGMVLAVVLVGLLVVSLFGAAVARSLIAQRQHVRRQEQRQQAFWLAESGLQRASHQLADDADYEGEQLRIESLESGLAFPGVVTISVQNVADPSAGHLLVVEAAYPADARLPSIERREFLVATRENQPTN